MYMVFDLLGVGGVDLRNMPWLRRRQRLEDLAAAWSGPLQLCPVTYDLDEAREWFDALGAMGIEGLVVKGRRTRYLPGHSSGWLKVRSDGVPSGRFAGVAVLCLVSVLLAGRSSCATAVAHADKHAWFHRHLTSLHADSGRRGVYWGR